MGGFKVIRQLQKDSPKTQIVVMSSHANDGAEQMGIRAVYKLKAGEDLASYFVGGE
jgi:hypothetical protein